MWLFSLLSPLIISQEQFLFGNEKHYTVIYFQNEKNKKKNNNW